MVEFSSTLVFCDWFWVYSADVVCTPSTPGEGPRYSCASYAGDVEVNSGSLLVKFGSSSTPGEGPPCAGMPGGVITCRAHSVDWTLQSCD